MVFGDPDRCPENLTGDRSTAARARLPDRLPDSIVASRPALARPLLLVGAEIADDH
jgi:hypothetical protein